MRTKFKAWAVEYLNTNFKNQFLLDNEDSVKEMAKFISERETYLEIGPGKGQFILGMAEKNPSLNFIVCELNETISGICLKKIDESGLTNVRLVKGDFYKMRELLKEDLFEGIFLNFSDPWPKKRHEKRRLTSDLFLLEYAKVLKENGKIYYKTDNDDFYLYSLEQFIKFKYDIIKKDECYDEVEDFDVETEYEKRFKAEGIHSKRLILQKTKDTIRELGDE